VVNENHLFRHDYSTLFSYNDSHLDQAATRPIKITITC